MNDEVLLVRFTFQLRRHSLLQSLDEFKRLDVFAESFYRKSRLIACPCVFKQVTLLNECALTQSLHSSFAFACNCRDLGD